MSKIVKQDISKNLLNSIYDYFKQEHNLLLDGSEILKYLKSYNNKLKIVTYDKQRKHKQKFKDINEIQTLVWNIVNFYGFNNDWTNTDTSNKLFFDLNHMCLYVCLSKNNKKFLKICNLFKEKYKEYSDEFTEKIRKFNKRKSFEKMGIYDLSTTECGNNWKVFEKICTTSNFWRAGELITLAYTGDIDFIWILMILFCDLSHNLDDDVGEQHNVMYFTTLNNKSEINKLFSNTLSTYWDDKDYEMNTYGSNIIKNSDNVDEIINKSKKNKSKIILIDSLQQLKGNAKLNVKKLLTFAKKNKVLVFLSYELNIKLKKQPTINDISSKTFLQNSSDKIYLFWEKKDAHWVLLPKNVGDNNTKLHSWVYIVDLVKNRRGRSCRNFLFYTPSCKSGVITCPNNDQYKQIIKTEFFNSTTQNIPSSHNEIGVIINGKFVI